MLETVSCPQTFGQALTLLYAYVICHALADYPLQGDFLARHKCRNYKPAAGEAHIPRGMWVHCLVGHSLIHSGFVWIVSGSVFFALAELVLHTVIDFLKGEGKTNFHTDQFLHLLCKIAYVLLAFQWCSAS